MGRTVEFNRQLYKVIGVMGPDLEMPSQTEFSGTTRPSGRCILSRQHLQRKLLPPSARLRPGATFSNAAGFLNLASQRVTTIPPPKAIQKPLAGAGLHHSCTQ